MHHMVAPSTRTGHSTGPDSTSEQEDDKEVFSECVCSYTSVWVCVRDGRYAVSSVQSGCGSEHKMTDWVMWVNVFSAYDFKIHNSILSLTTFLLVTKGGCLAPMSVRDVQKHGTAKRTSTLNWTHTQLSQLQHTCVVAGCLINEFWACFFFLLLCAVSHSRRIHLCKCMCAYSVEKLAIITSTNNYTSIYNYFFLCPIQIEC